jgi:hypothetical protein
MEQKKQVFELWQVRVDRSQAKPKVIKEKHLKDVKITDDQAEIINRGRIEGSGASGDVVEFYYPKNVSE